MGDHRLTRILDLFGDVDGAAERGPARLCHVCTRAVGVLARQAGAPAGALGTDLEALSEFHLVAHQAAGMVSAQTSASPSR